LAESNGLRIARLLSAIVAVLIVAALQLNQHGHRSHPARQRNRPEATRPGCSELLLAVGEQDVGPWLTHKPGQTAVHRVSM
jgi:hypothetical protein